MATPPLGAGRAPALPRCPIAVPQGLESQFLLDNPYVNQRLGVPRAPEAFRVRRQHPPALADR